jgi:purine-binding chemotaxis protein CheW
MSAAPSPQALVPGPAAHRDYLAFTLGGEDYAIDIRKVREIRRYEAPTRIAGAPAFVKGVVNLRGEIVPIVDLRIRFGQADVAYGPFTVVIVLALDGRLVGMVADGVSDVISLDPAHLRAPPDLGTATRLSYVVALAAMAERMLIVIDIERLLGGDLAAVPAVGPGIPEGTTC